MATPIKIYWAIEESRKAAFDAAFSGNTELPWIATDLNGTRWCTYPGSYFDSEVTDRQAEFAAFEAWFRVVEPNLGVMVMGNDPNFEPYAPDDGYDEWLDACGLTLIDESGLGNE